MAMVGRISMKFTRLFVLKLGVLGLGGLLGFGSAALAVPASTGPEASASAPIVQVAASEAGTATVKKKTARKPDGKTRPAASKKAPAKPKAEAAAAVPDIVREGNNGELRSDVEPRSNGFLGLFGVTQPAMLQETRALDAVLREKEARKPFKVKPAFEPQEVSFSGYPRGTIVIDTDAHFLYLVESSNRARRYAIAVGRDGLQFKGDVTVGDKQEWPRWIPTLDMQKREPKNYGRYKDGMAGGPGNPLGARAIYLYQGRKDTHLRIHGTNQPQTIGTNSSNGCFRMVNEHVMDLYRRVRVGTKVVIL
jgi:lipoprotein-anchoring transpeptidase ErfK/SrfK